MSLNLHGRSVRGSVISAPLSRKSLSCCQASTSPVSILTPCTVQSTSFQPPQVRLSWEKRVPARQDSQEVIGRWHNSPLGQRKECRIIPELPAETQTWYIWHWADTSAYRPPLTSPAQLNTTGRLPVWSLLTVAVPEWRLWQIIDIIHRKVHARLTKRWGKSKIVDFNLIFIIEFELLRFFLRRFREVLKLWRLWFALSALR